ncbi:MAG: hypothetical protein GY854_21045 [Deltaproteobacteria bacterium]|nr:hypothetical protein [Deltaproteobacteria bacterium]
MTLRICTYNVEHFNRLFISGDNQLDLPKAQTRLDALQQILQAVDADVIGIVEAPNTQANGPEDTVTRLQNFANAIGIRANQAVMGYVSRGAQELAVLHDPQVQVQHQPGGQADNSGNPPFNGQFLFDTDDDTIKEVYEHYRPPLEVSVNGGGHQFQLIVAHTKTKGIFNSVDVAHWELENMRARRKLLAECTWIRQRVEEWLGQNLQVVVVGDFNDGPGMDYYEHKLGKSAMEIVMGDLFKPDEILVNLAQRPQWKRSAGGWKPSTTRFKDRFTHDYVTVMIDHIMSSQGLPFAPNNPHRIWNPYEDAALQDMKQVFTTASDHFPVTLDLL